MFAVTAPEPVPDAAASRKRLSRCERMACCRAFIRNSGSNAGLGALRGAHPPSFRSAQLVSGRFTPRAQVGVPGALMLPTLARRAARRPRATSTSSCDGPPSLPSPEADLCNDLKRLSTAVKTSDWDRRGEGLGDARRELDRVGVQLPAVLVELVAPPGAGGGRRDFA